jgi:hypothetical protein
MLNCLAAAMSRSRSDAHAIPRSNCNPIGTFASSPVLGRLEIARRCRSSSYSFLRDGLPVIDIGVDSEPAHDVALFNCPGAHERIRYHPELATVSLQIAREESTHVYREGSEAIQYPRPRSHSGIVQPQRSQE